MGFFLKLATSFLPQLNILHRSHGGTAPEEAETQFATGLGIDGRPAKFRQAGDRRCEDGIGNTPLSCSYAMGFVHMHTQ